jgi:hypothetical protein
LGSASGIFGAESLDISRPFCHDLQLGTSARL